MDHQPDHPARRLIDNNNNNNIAILSPLVQLSFVFHLAIAQLQKHSHNHPDSVVTVIIGSSTQASFQKALIDENDAFLMKASSDNSALSNLLERIEFRYVQSVSLQSLEDRPGGPNSKKKKIRFCADLAQLLVLLCDLSHQSLPVLSQSPRIALIFTDVTRYLISMTSLSRTNWVRPKPSLSDLTRLLGFISSVQLQLASIYQLNHPPPIYLLDRIEPTQKWPFSATRSASISNDLSEDHHHLRGLLEIFQHFFRRTWMIESLESSSGPQSKRDDNNSNTSNEPGRRMRMYSHRSRSKISTDNETDDHCHQDQIIYQVLDDLQDQNGQYSNSINPTGLLRRTVVV
ncbi:hypothetical protein KEM48_005674 [Puccinia striiformis f. sp. tritici PST-130]|nr:hypothetical protein KEM48_005674 [Puccinia striiformis f. sp. tritici PST-130]